MLQTQIEKITFNTNLVFLMSTSIAPAVITPTNRRDTGVTKVSHTKVLSFTGEANTSVKVSSVHCCFDVNNFSKYKLRGKCEQQQFLLCVSVVSES